MLPRRHSLTCACLALAAAIGWMWIKNEVGPSRRTANFEAVTSRGIAGDAPHTQNHPVSTVTRRAPHPASIEAEISAVLDENFSRSILSADQTLVKIPVPGGELVEGNVTRIEDGDDGPLLVEGLVTHPEPGRFHFRRQTLPGKAGPLFGFIHFDKGIAAWQVRPTVAGDGAQLVRTTVHDVICRSYAAAPANIPAAHPLDDPIPPAENGIIQLQSLPGAEAVVYLDFDGESRDFEVWGPIDAAPSGASNQQIFEIWQGVCEDFQPFNLNITTMRSVFEDAAPNRRMHVIVTPTDDASPGAGGVAIIGSFNTQGDVVCWAFQTTGKNAVEVISHEVGHTLGLSHDGRVSPFEEYYAGHFDWAPIMGIGYDKPVTHWSKGEYPNANNIQDDLLIISSTNNSVAYRADDHGSNSSTAGWLDITEDGDAYAEGIIERNTDRDSFRFSTTGGNLSIQVNPVPAIGGGSVPVANLDIKAELLQVTSSLTSIIATSSPGSSLAAYFNISSLPAGDYLVRVSGSGKNNLITGYSNYASLGSYTITGTVSGGVHAERFVIAENSVNGTVVGSVTPRANHSTGTLSYEISGGGAFAIDPQSGTITVADSSLLDFEALSSRWDDPATFAFTVTIGDSLEYALETIRVVVALSDVNEAPVFDAIAPVIIPSSVSPGTAIAKVRATDPDRGDYIDYSIAAGNAAGAFAIDPATGEVTVAGTLDYQNTPVHNLVIRATDQADPPNETETTLTVSLLPLPGDVTAGSIMRTFYRGLPGFTLADLTSSPRFPDKPDSQKVLSSFDSGTGEGFEYGSVLSGYLIAPVTGSYTFWISAGDAGELWLSSDDDPLNAQPIAAVTSATPPGVWNQEAGQQSDPVGLEAGQLYYIEARHKQGYGTDHVQVAWQGPGMLSKQIIPGLWLAPDARQFAPWAENATFQVRDGAAAGSIVGGIAFIEPNLGQQVASHAITGGNEDGYFTIGETDGLIRVAEGAAFAAGETYQLTISATDDADPSAVGSAVAQVNVRRLDEGMHAWWQLDETTGTIAFDSSGNQRDAWLAGGFSWVPRAAADGALQLNGSDAGFSHHDIDSPSGITPFTVAAWVKISPDHDTEGVIIQKNDGTGFGPPGYYRLSVTADGQVRFAVYGDDMEMSGADFQFDLVSTETINDGEWHHVAGVRDGETGRLFIDSVETASGSGTTRLLPSEATTSVGYDATLPGAFLDAIIDDVRIYREALSSAQLARIADAPKIAISSPLADGAAAVIPPGVGLLLEAAASQPLGSAPGVTWSLVSGPGSVVFGSPAAAETTALFSTNGTYHLRATASDGTDTISRDLQVNYGCTAVTPFGGTLIGSEGSGMYSNTSPGAYQLNGDSSGILAEGTDDGFYLLGQVFAGNFDVRTRAVSAYDDEFGDPLGLAGLIIRAGTAGATDDASGFIGLRPDAGTWIRRETNGAPNAVTDYPGVSAPHWCRISRTDDTVEFWHSPDGIAWSSRGTMTFAGEVLVGMCWSSNFTGFPGTAQFSGLAGFSTGNVGATVDAGTDISAETTIATALGGSTDDDGLPAPPAVVTTEWSLVSGPGPVDVADPADPLSAITFGAAGNYILRLSADDGAIRTFDEVGVTVTDPLPVVTVAATTPEAAEPGPVDGVFTITRSGWLVGDLTVDFTLAGTAENGVDFIELPLSAVIPDGLESVDVIVSPLADSEVEGPETVVLNLVAGNYLISNDTAEVIIADSNHAPQFANDPVIASEATEDSAYSDTIAGSATDPDAGDSIVFSKEIGPGWLSIAEDGTLSGTPGAGDVGLNQFTIRATDAGGLFAEALLEIAVAFANQPPSFASELPTPPPAVAQIPYSGFSLAGSADDPNLPQGDEITFSKLSGPDWVEVTADGSLAGTPGTDDIGPNLIEVRVSDLAGAFADATIEIIVGPTILYLDANGETAGSGAIGAIDWDTAAVWSAGSDGTGATYPWVPGAIAVLSAGDDADAAVITLAGNQSLGGLTVEEGAPVLTGGGLVLAETDVTFDTAADTIIESTVTGTNLGKAGAATLTLAGSDHTLTGELAIISGTLQLTGSLTAAGGITVAAGSTLTGDGTLTGAAQVTGTLAPGAELGTLIVGALAMNDGAELAWRIDSWDGAAGSDYDLVTAESLELSGTLTIDVDAVAMTDFIDAPAQFTLVTTTGGITGLETTDFVIDTNSLPAATGHWNIAVNANDLLLTYTPLSPFEQWQITQFAEKASDPQVAGEMMDPDNDDLPNLVEYALGTDPEVAGPSTITQDFVEIEGTPFLRLTVPRNPDATDLVITVETTSDLSAAGSWTDLDTVIETDEPSLLLVRDALGGSRRFMRLKISR